MSRTIYFVRHGETEWNKIKRMQGQLDAPLSPEGEAHADGHGRFLATRNIEAIYASPLGRVQQTVSAIRQHVPIEPVIDDRLKEWHSGDWSGFMYADLPQKWPEEWAAWEADRFSYRPPGAENYPDMIARADSFMEELLATQHRTIALVSHGMIGRCLISHLLKLTPEEILQVRQKNDVVFAATEEANGTWSSSHFVAGEGPVEGLPTSMSYPSA